MNDSKISVRYAKALFESAIDKDLLDKIEEDMKLVLEITGMRQYKQMLFNPVVKESEKIKLTETLLSDKVEDLTISLLRLVIRNDREQHIAGIARNYLEQYREYRGISSAVFTSVLPADSDLKKRVEKVIGDALNTPVDLVTEADESLIGGFILRIEDQQYDASVASNLNKVKKQLLKST